MHYYVDADNDSEHMMKILNQVLAGLLVLLGCIHNFVAAPMTYSNLSTQALWFVSAGLALWYAGFINLLRAQSDNGGRLLAWLALVTNATLLAFVASYATVRSNWTAPESLFLVGVVAALTTTSALSLTKSLIRA
jgi:ABC-type Fe3+-siderophore transport system permease subunit